MSTWMILRIGIRRPYQAENIKRTPRALTDAFGRKGDRVERTVV
jgi:hypothetical protein